MFSRRAISKESPRIHYTILYHVLLGPKLSPRLMDERECELGSCCGKYFLKM
jgi:hypothetical protein